LDATKLTGSIPTGSYGATTIPITAISLTGADGTKYLRGDGTWGTPGGSGDMLLGSSQVVTALKTYNKATLAMKGGITGTGITTLASAIADGSSNTVTFPSGTGTLALTSDQFYLGTTAIPMNSTSGSITTLNGVSIGGNAGTATNLANGQAGTIPYQTGVGLTSMTGVGNAGQVLTSQGASAPTWTSVVTGVTGTAPIVVSASTTTPDVSINAATTTAAGSMSATDKAKLDNIQNFPGSGAGNVLTLNAGGTGATWVAPAGGSSIYTLNSGKFLVKGSGPNLIISQTGKNVSITIPSGASVDYIRINSNATEIAGTEIWFTITDGNLATNSSSLDVMMPVVAFLHKNTGTPSTTTRNNYVTPGTSGAPSISITGCASNVLSFQVLNETWSGGDGFAVILNY